MNEITRNFQRFLRLPELIEAGEDSEETELLDGCLSSRMHLTIPHEDADGDDDDDRDSGTGLFSATNANRKRRTLLRKYFKLLQRYYPLQNLANLFKLVFIYLPAHPAAAFVEPGQIGGKPPPGPI